ncbi:uncharacterized protein LOC134181571 [Corticium candelabrum]|uniref:uncharacterized protein LOC134181571 n=1 Tax=Corticium candelabrum TaxID=121492 RepID=UPI002E25C674|nr:uncharacterized protein LOC134181571 [Corticium candelabrum]
MTRLRCSLTPTEELFTECEKFVCHLYGLPTCTSVNEVRYKLFRMKCSKAQQMPPTQDALRQHVLRVNYQSFVRKNALCSMQNLPSPHGHGWIVETDENGSHIHVCWMTQLPAPKALLELVSCTCNVGCTTQQCSCLRAALCCTDACGCRNCKNLSKQIDLPSPVLSEEETPESDIQTDDSNNDDCSDSE